MIGISNVISKYNRPVNVKLMLLCITFFQNCVRRWNHRDIDKNVCMPVTLLTEISYDRKALDISLMAFNLYDTKKKGIGFFPH